MSAKIKFIALLKLPETKINLKYLMETIENGDTFDEKYFKI